MKFERAKIFQVFVLLCVVLSAGFVTKRYIDKRLGGIHRRLNGMDHRMNDMNNWERISVDGRDPRNKLMIKESLRKYRYIFDKEYKTPKNYVNKYPNRIWVFWDKGFEKAPDLVKMCLESMKKYSAGRIVETLDENNLEKYIKLPDYIIKRYKDGKMSRQLFADIIRVVLLRDYGGLWIDATTYLTGDIPQYMFDAELFAPLYYKSADIKNFYSYRSPVIIPNYFMAANAPHNYLFQCWSEFYFESLKEFTSLPYFSSYAFPAMAMEESGKISNMMYKLCDNKDRKHDRTFWHLYAVHEKPFNEREWQEIKKFPIHKLSAKHMLRLISSGKVKPGSFLDKLLRGELK